MCHLTDHSTRSLNDLLGGTLITIANDATFTVSQIQTSKKSMDNLYPRMSYTLPDAPKVEVVEIKDDVIGYEVTGVDVVIDGTSVAQGTTYSTTGLHTLQYTEDGQTITLPLIIFEKGDANLDNQIGITDLVRMKRQTNASNRYVPNKAGKLSSDISGDGNIKDDDTDMLRDILLAEQGEGA